MLSWLVAAPRGWKLLRGQTCIATVAAVANGMLEVWLIDEHGAKATKTLCAAKSRDLLALWAGQHLPKENAPWSP
jgi:hypothetical protein